MDNFVYEYQTKVYFGKGSVQEHLLKELSRYGKNILLAYGGGSIKGNGIYDEILEVLRKNGKVITEISEILPNPTYAKVQEGARIVRENHIDFILAVGGGSVIDCCKIIAQQATMDDDIWKMEIENHQLPDTMPIPMGAIVTASGTGAEMNGGAVITHEEKKIKTGLFSLAPRFAILDPMYTMTVPFTQVISGAFDTLSHAMETYFGYPNINNVSDDINEAIMKNTIKNIRVLLEDKNNYNARSNLMWDSAIAENGLLKLGKKTDFQAHQMEHQLGAYTNCNHGQGLAVIHPVYYRHIYKDGLSKFVSFAKNVWMIKDIGKTDEEVALEGIQALADFIKECGLPTTFSELIKDHFLLSDEILKEIAYSCNIASGSYKKMTHEEIFEIFKECK